MCSLSDFDGIRSLTVAAGPSFHHIAIAAESPYRPSHSRITVVGAPLGEPTFWERMTLDLPGPAQYRSFKVPHIVFFLGGEGGERQSVWNEITITRAKPNFCLVKLCGRLTCTDIEKSRSKALFSDVHFK